jgi:hypothetical protein
MARIFWSARCLVIPQTAERGDGKIIDFLDIIHRPIFFLFKNNISETGLCLRSQAKAYRVQSPKRCS